ncbi:MAG: hypothetical protein AAFW69_12825 [Pseudomonadota bacterium]
MISIDDIIGLTDLTREEIDAVAEHEHIPEAAAAALADYLLHRTGGAQLIRRMIAEDIRDALARGDTPHARELFAALRHFEAHHAEELAAG